VSERYTIISSDCHAGGNHAQYREYLDPAYIDEFDAWRGKYSNPFRDLQDDGRSRNWDNDRRINDLNNDGTVAEIIFPNTVPPFFPTGVVIAPAPRPEELPRRLAGIRAHNRWLADFVAAAPDRRFGQGQIFVNDVDEAIKDVRWCKDHGINGVLLPGVSPDTPWIKPLFDPIYDPLWAVCEELDMPVTHHGGGSGLPDYGRHPFSTAMYVMEVGFFANRALWHFCMSGIFDRFPKLKLILTEQGTAWLPEVLNRMDSMHDQMVRGRIGEIGGAEGATKRRPTEYFADNVWIGASFPAPSDVKAWEKMGLHKFMWGSDYPHNEATSPYSKEHLRLTFAGWTPEKMKMILSENAAAIYGFDLAKLAPLGDQFGPTVEELATPLDEIPADATSPAFRRG